jgi:menaquinone-dependent protoporphyrinogen IX oxidase
LKKRKEFTMTTSSLQGKKILIAYATDSGSTSDVAIAIGKVFTKSGATVEVKLIESIVSLDEFDAAIIGAPEIVGWHRQAKSFLHKNKKRLAKIPVAYFITLMSLTQPDSTNFDGIPIACDPELTHEPEKEGRLTFKERYSSVENYLAPLWKEAPSVKPVGVAFFGGKLSYYRMNWFRRLFVMAIINASPGDRRNWDFIRSWAESILPLV